MPKVKNTGNDNTQADNAVAEVFFFAPSPAGEGEIKLAKLSISFPNWVKKATVKMNTTIEVEVEKDGQKTKATVTCCRRGGTWVWDFGDA